MRSRESKTLRRLISLVRAVRILKNWHAVLPDLFRIGLGIKPKGNLLQLRNGFSFVMYPHSRMHPVFLEVFCTSVYDRNPLFEIGSHDTVIDIGAHVGFFTLKAAHLADKGRVYAFEPCSPHFELLKENVRRNCAENIMLFKCAVWGESQEIELLYSLDGEPLDTSIYTIGGNRKELVSAMTLDEVFRRCAIAACDFMKIDCEGAEYGILYSTPDHILRRIRRIALEWHRFDGSHAPADLARYLTDKGFKLLGSDNWTGVTGHMYAYRENRPSGS